MLKAIEIRKQGYISDHFFLSEFSMIARYRIKEVLLATFQILHERKDSVTGPTITETNHQDVPNTMLVVYNSPETVIYAVLSAECKKYAYYTLLQAMARAEPNRNDEITILTAFQNNSLDKISAVQGTIDETRHLILDNIDKLLKRGERIEDLLQQTEDLSVSSKAFLKSSKKLNKCCVIV